MKRSCGRNALRTTPDCKSSVIGCELSCLCREVSVHTCTCKEFQPAFEVELVGNDRDLARLACASRKQSEWPNVELGSGGQFLDP